MRIILVICGKTASGKDTIVNKLVSSYGYKKIVAYTTRPMRPNEKQNVTYHFISEDEFCQKVDSGFFVEHKTYNTKFGVWHYGISLKDLENADENTIIILTPDGYREIIKRLFKKPKSVYIYANNSTIKDRLINRGDNKDESQRRIAHDNSDFKGLENEVDKIVYNNKGTDINEVVKKILNFLGEKNEL